LLLFDVSTLPLRFRFKTVGLTPDPLGFLFHFLCVLCDSVFQNPF
jgi:hypothetical protein